MQVALAVATFLVVVGQIGVQVTLLTGPIDVLLAVVLGSAGLAFSLGARSLVANILASHHVQGLYEVGERIRIGDTEGCIVRVLPTLIVIEAADGEVAIPADEFTHTRSVRVQKGA